MLAPLIQHENLFPILSSRLPKLLPKTSQTLHPMPVFEARVLVVEDDAALRRLLTMLLERENYYVVAVANGAEAVSTFAQYAFDLILMDIEMPGMDGYEATRRIREFEGAGPRTPIVAMTAHAIAGTEETCRAVGFDDYLTKPIDPEALQLLLARVASGELLAVE